MGLVLGIVQKQLPRMAINYLLSRVIATAFESLTNDPNSAYRAYTCEACSQSFHSGKTLGICPRCGAVGELRYANSEEKLQLMLRKQFRKA